MRRFRRVRGHYSATFESLEVKILAELVDQVRGLLADRRESAGADPLVALTGMAAAPAAAPEDAVLARLLPDFDRDDAERSGGLRQLHEPGIIAAKDAAATVLLDSLPPGGGTVHLDEDQARAWITALNDLRLAFGVRLGLEDEEQDLDAPTGDEEVDRIRSVTVNTYRWLSAVQDSLVEQMLR